MSKSFRPPAPGDDIERQAAAGVPRQLPLLGEDKSVLAEIDEPELPRLTPSSTLGQARAQFRRKLELERRPKATVEAYSYDLVRFADRVGPKPINQITQSDVAGYLGLAASPATRKRRLTTLRGFFRFLIEDARVLTLDPTGGFQPHLIRLRQPSVLDANDQRRLIDAADVDEPWSGLAIRLMLSLGLSRSEVLAVTRDQFAVDPAGQLVVTIVNDNPSRQQQERQLLAGEDLQRAFERFDESFSPIGRLFPVGFQAINKMVDRVAKRAGLADKVTPQMLRHSFAAAHARAGTPPATLIKLLGLVDEPRNRLSIDRYYHLAAMPLSAEPPVSAPAARDQLPGE